MQLLGYYILHTFKNTVKKLFRTWVAVFIGIMLLFAVIGGVIGYVAGSAIDNAEPEEGYEEIVEVEEDIPPFAQDAQTLRREITELAVGGVALLIIMLNIYTGDKSGAQIFKMPDVNFLFQAPMRPQSVLMFRMVTRMGLALVSTIYLVFQTANFVNAGFKAIEIISLFVSYFFMLFIGQLCSVYTYTITATHTRLRKYVRPLVIVVTALLFAVYFAAMAIGKKGFYQTAILLFASKWGRLIPVFGWFRGFIVYLLAGNYALSLACLAGLIVASIILMLMIRGFKADFYEDALQGAEKAQEALEKAKSGKRATRKKEHSKSVVREYEFKYSGSAVLYEKAIYNRRRFAKFSVFTPSSVTYLFIALAVTAFCVYIVGYTGLVVLGFVLLGTVFFKNLTFSANEETQTNFLYMLPDSAHKKLFFIIASNAVNTLVELVPALFISSLMCHADFFVVLKWLAVIITFNIFCFTAGLFIEFFIPVSLADSLKSMMGVMLKMLAIIPGAIALVFGVTVLPLSVGIWIAVTVNTVFSALLYLLTAPRLHSGRK